jgi:N-acyl-D-aspartate/D-glutamate deacylase
LSLAERMAYLRNQENRRRLDAAVHVDKSSVYSLLARWADWSFAETFDKANKPFEGRTVGEVAQKQGKTPFDAMLDVVLADDLRTCLVVPPRGTDDASWRLRAQMWRDERTVIGASDAGAHLDMLDGFASAPELLRVGVRERQLISLEEAVRQLTSVPAALYGLVGRGLLQVGHWADVAVIDPKTIACGKLEMRADLPGGASRLFAEAIGIRNVLVNGREIVRGQTFLGEFPGVILRSGRDTRTVSIPARQ